MRPVPLRTLIIGALVLLVCSTTADSLADSSPVPSQSKIAYTSAGIGGPVANIAVINADGSGQTKLTNCQTACEQPAWSPDGRKLAFVSEDVNKAFSARIYTMNANRSGLKLLPTHFAAYDPAWSPDGKQIAFSSLLFRGGIADIYVINVDGSGLTRLTNNLLSGHADSSPTWSPDGDQIAFERDSGSGSNLAAAIYVMYANGSGRRALTDRRFAAQQPDWSPDGTKIVYVGGASLQAGEAGAIYVMDADGSNPQQVQEHRASAYQIAVSSPTWSPDGKQIAFVVNDVRGPNDLYVMNADGSSPRHLTHGGGAPTPDWQPSGANRPTSPPSRVNPDDAPMQIVFVHGIRSACDEPGKDSYVALYRKLVGQGRGVYSFCYDHDWAYDKHRTGRLYPGGRDPWRRDSCFSPTEDYGGTSVGEDGAIKLSVPFDPDTFPLSASQSPADAQASDIFDTDGPLAYDATKLNDCLVALRNYDIRTHGSPEAIAVIGNSMGGAITRGWLSLAQATESPALSAVTTVILLESATEGAWVARVGHDMYATLEAGANSGSWHVGTVTSIPLVVDFNKFAYQTATDLSTDAKLLPSRPGVKDLAPNSDYYTSIWSGVDPPHLHYFTFSVDITVNFKTRFLWWTSSTGNSTDFLGDGIMQLGDPAANGHPDWGGSQFLPFGEAADQHQYVIRRSHDAIENTTGALEVAGDIPATFAALLQAETGDDYGHFNFGNKIGVDKVESCRPGLGAMLIPDEILRVLSNPAQACAS